MTLTKADLSEILFDRVGLNKREAKDMVEAFFEEASVGDKTRILRKKHASELRDFLLPVS